MEFLSTHLWDFALLFWGFISLRTLLWHLQQWQIREYRFDRMRAHLQTQAGKKSLYNLWFFRGLLPRPRFTARIALMLLVILVLNGALFWYFWEQGWFVAIPKPTLFLLLFLWERTLWLQVALSVWITGFFTSLAKKRLFKRAKAVISQSDPKIIRIGITGSYGKSSTKEILVHLLQYYFGKDAVCFNPENQNNEIAIARLILAKAPFFRGSSSKPRFCVMEIGAYKKGEIAEVCRFFSPHRSILTGVNTQHLALFGSQENILSAKFELAEGTREVVYFNADNAFLQKIFADKEIQAQKVAISKSVLENLKSYPDKTTFMLYGKPFELPWPGAFFAQNALLALEVAREVGVPISVLQKALKSLPPLKRALHIFEHKAGFWVLRDPYSANPDGVMAALHHLSHFKGRKYIISIPLKELGEKALEEHRRIFERVKALNAKLFWLGEDFASLGKEVLGKRFQRVQDISALKALQKTLKKGDVVLLESRLPKEVEKLFLH